MIRNGISSLILALIFIGAVSGSPLQSAEDLVVGLSASDVLGSEDIWGNPSFVGGAANGGSTSHGVW